MDAVCGPISRAHDYIEEIWFINNNISLSWLTSGCPFREDANPLLAGLWFQLALHQGMKWWEVADA